MDIDWVMVLATFGIGIVVGLTGMGGGALMTPALVLFFGVPPLTAVSSDLVASAVMKPVEFGRPPQEGDRQPAAGEVAVCRISACGLLRRARPPCAG